MIVTSAIPELTAKRGLGSGKVSPDKIARISRKGVEGRAKSLTAEERTQIARKAAAARWAKSGKTS